MITEMFSTYRPSDWRGLIDEFLAVEDRRQVNGNGKPMNGNGKYMNGNGKHMNGTRY